MASKQTVQITMPSKLSADSTKSLFSIKDSKKMFSLNADLLWKITISLAIVIIAGIMIYQAVRDNKKSSIQTSLSPHQVFANDGEESTEKRTAKCRAGAIEDSQARFTYTPYNSSQPYTTHGLEFNFEDIKKKVGIESGITELSGAHYYYNLPRCEIDGKLQLDNEPIIRGPIVFAINEQCTKAYYFKEGWKEYSSARDFICTAHGNQIKTVEKSECLKGSIKSSNSSFVYVAFGTTEPYRATGAEFSFEAIARKSKLGSTLTKLNNLIASTSQVHYYYNILRCQIGGGTQVDKEPIIRGPLVFAVDQQCNKVYYFRDGKGWIRYATARNIACSSHGSNNETECFQGSIQASYFTFAYFSGSIKKSVHVTGIQYSFAKLVAKLQHLRTDFNSTKIPELSTSQAQDASYYLNLQRCYNGGPHDLKRNPPIGGASFFAVNDNCSKVYYLSSTYQWVSYKTATSITCTNRRI